MGPANLGQPSSLSWVLSFENSWGSNPSDPKTRYLGPSRKGSAFLSLYRFRVLVGAKISVFRQVCTNFVFLLVLRFQISDFKYVNTFQCYAMSRSVAQCPGALRNTKQFKFSFVHQCYIIYDMHWLKGRGRQLLLAKVRIPIGRIGIIWNENPFHLLKN